MGKSTRRSQGQAFVSSRPALTSIPNYHLVVRQKAMSLYSLVTVLLLAPLYLASASYMPNQRAPPTVAGLKYSRAHSLESGYNFDPRDGWQPVNISNLSYKYGPSPTKVHRPTKSISKLKSILYPITKVLKGLKGFGKPEKVTITWWAQYNHAG